MALPAIMLGWQISGWIFFLPAAMHGRADFRQLYTAGYMIRTGHSGELYDFAAQQRFQDAVVSPQLSPLPFIRPAYQALLFYPFSFVSYKTAYFFFLALNVVLLGLSFRMLRPRLVNLAAVWKPLPLAMFISFIPTGVALMQGQDSILLLLLFSATLLSLERDAEFLAGVLTGFALFKFQIAIPVAILFFCWKRWRFLGGFCVCGGVLALLSVWIMGFAQAMTHVRLLLSMQTGLGSGPAQLQFPIQLKKMMNLHGLVYGIGEGHIGLRTITLLTLSVSIVFFGWVAVAGFRLRREDQFKAAIASAVVVSYYMFVHDLVILLIPLTLILSETISLRGKRAWLAVLATCLFLAPALVSSAYLFSVPLVLFVCLWLGSAPAGQRLGGSSLAGEPAG
jgi:Glycosyltransferase family 87